MKKSVLFFAGMLFFSQLLWGQDFDKNAMDSVFIEWNKSDAPGAALAIVSDGKLIYSKGYGMADLEHDIAIQPSSVFYIGSVSKQFVTFCILLLEEEGKLDLDDNIQKYFPDFPTYSGPLTIRNFIHHTSGVRDYLTLFSLKGRSYLDHIEVEEAYELIRSQKELNFTPGDRYLYSNSCYFMLGLIVEKVSGQSLKEFAEENIFGPLGMRNTLFYDDNTDLIKNKAFSYQPNGDGFNNLILRFDLVGSGGIYSTVEDLYLWDQNFYHNKLGKGTQTIIDKMHEEGKLNNGESAGYAFALNNGEYKGLRTVSHGGALAGYRAELMRFPDQKFSVIILANRGDANPTSKAYEVADIFLKDQFKIENESTEKESSPKAKKLDLSKIKKQALTGRFEVMTGVEASLTVQNDTLFVEQHWNNERYPIFLESDSNYVHPEDLDIKFSFVELNNGKVQKLVVTQGSQITLAKRKEIEEQKNIVLNDYAGTYFSEELNINYALSVNEGHLECKIVSGQQEKLINSGNDTFSAQGLQFRFQRKNGEIAGFELDAGRVQNLKFMRLN